MTDPPKHNPKIPPNEAIEKEPKEEKLKPGENSWLVWDLEALLFDYYFWPPNSLSLVQK